MPTSRRNFGFQHKQKAIPQLYSVLKIDVKSNEAKAVREALNDLAKQFLDSNKTPTAQRDKMDQIEAEIIKRYPETYGGQQSAKRCYYARQVIMYLHTLHRNNIKSRALWKQATKHRQRRYSSDISEDIPLSKKNLSSSSLTYPLASSSTSSASKENSRPDIATSEVASKGSLSMPNTNIAPRSKFRPAYPSASTNYRTQTFISRGLNLTTPRTQPNPSQAEDSVLVPSSSESSPSPFDITQSRQSLRTPGGTGVTYVRSFLTSCRPSMEKYLHRFIDYGCRSQDYLYSMSTWDPERQIKVLRKILSGPDDMPLNNEMDIEIMQAQLETYFMFTFTRLK